jgi:hypothetical protein
MQNNRGKVVDKPFQSQIITVPTACFNKLEIHIPLHSVFLFHTILTIDTGFFPNQR